MTACPVFIGGEWRALQGLATSPVFNPSRGEVIAEVPLGGYIAVELRKNLERYFDAG